MKFSHRLEIPNRLEPGTGGSILKPIPRGKVAMAVGNLAYSSKRISVLALVVEKMVSKRSCNGG